MVEFGDDLRITYVMGGLAREFDDPAGMIVPWLDAADRSGMPVDPRLWAEAPLSSSYPACMAVKAAAEQGVEAEARYLRALREGIFCFRRKLDTVEALVEAARGVGLDAARFRSSLESNAIVEAFGADLEETRSAGMTLPAFDAAPPGWTCSASASTWSRTRSWRRSGRIWRRRGLAARPCPRCGSKRRLPFPASLPTRSGGRARWPRAGRLLRNRS